MRPYVGGRPSDDEVKDEPEEDMLSRVAVEGEMTDRAVGTCHDTARTRRGWSVVCAGAVLKIRIIGTGTRTVYRKVEVPQPALEGRGGEGR